MAVLNLTEARVRELPLGSGIHRDEQVKGLMVVCHRTTRTYAVQGDVRRNGRHVRTVRVKVDRCDRIGLREARRRAKELMSQIQSGVDPTAGPAETGITLAQVMDRYADGRGLSPRTVEGYRYNLDHYLKGLRNRAVADITRTEVRDLFDSIRRRSGETTAGSAMRTLRLLVNEARRMDETIEDNPVSALRVPQTNRREVGEIDMRDWWSRSEALSPIRRDAHRFFMFSGLRRESLLTIERRDVDLAGRIVEVKHMKSGRPFLLPLSDFMADMLRKRLEADERIASRWLWPSPTSESGRVMEPKEDGLPSPHEYRHHWRTQSIAAGVPYAESALLLDQRLPGASGGYVHQRHLAEHLRSYQQKVELVNLGLLAQGMRARMPWSVARRIFALCEVPRGQGWEQTLDLLSKGKFQPTPEQYQALLDLFREHVISGEKSTRFYDLSKKQMEELRTRVLKAKVKKSSIAESYPLPVSEEALAGSDLSAPELVAVEQMDDGIAAIYSSIRAIELRDQLARTDVPQPARQLFDRYSQVIGVRTLKVQAFDALWIPKDGTRVDVRVDCPFGMTQEATLAAHEAARSASAKLVDDEAFESTVNLFPVIDRMYRAKNEGTVVELAFGTTTASLKHEKMRRKHIDLRTEIYHKGGTAAVNGEIEPFNIGIEWTVPGAGERLSRPELVIHGTSRLLHTEEPKIFDAVVRKCTGVQDFEFVRAKINKYLQAK